LEECFLVSGVGNQIGNEYKFPSAISGVGAFVTVKEGAHFPVQTIILLVMAKHGNQWKNPNVQGVSSSYVSFKIDFKDSADGHKHLFPFFQLSFTDADGDNQHVKEFVAAKGADQIIVSNVTNLTLSTITPNFIQATGTFHNYPGIDIATYVTNINYNYKNANHIDEVRFGNITDSIFTVQDRYSCGYFRPVAMPNFYVLPVKYLLFNATAEENAVTLKWITEQEFNNHHFEVERSFDGNNFKAIGLVSGGFEDENRKNYQFKDKDAELRSKSIVYYRLKQVDNAGKVTLTNTLIVKLQAKMGVVMQTSPNPFTENLNVSFATTENGFAVITITSINGQKMITKQATVRCGYNNLQLNDLMRLAPGMYTAQLIINGAIVSNQKIIKN
jgi:Secretion system C-terminal sorting domain